MGLTRVLWLLSALTAVADNLPLNFAAKPGFQFFLQQLLGEKRLAVPSADAVAKSVLQLHDSVVLAATEAMGKAKSVRPCCFLLSLSHSNTAEIALQLTHWTPHRSACRSRRGASQRPQQCAPRSLWR